MVKPVTYTLYPRESLYRCESSTLSWAVSRGLEVGLRPGGCNNVGVVRGKL